MKYLIITVIGFITLPSCTYRPQEKPLAQFKNDDTQILESFYKQSSDTLEFKRILSSQTGLKIQRGQIFLTKYGLTRQRFKKIEELDRGPKTLDSLTTQFTNEGLVKRLFEDRDVMFIQILPDTAMDNIDGLRFLNLRQDIEGKIDERLQNKDLGEWFAGDMGAGANMLFFIDDDWKGSLDTVKDLLREENLLDHVLITKRIMISKKDWSYEIVYPTDYEGVFNSM